MMGFDAKFDQTRLRSMKQRIDKGLFRSVGHAAAAIRSTARFLITRSKEPAAEGEPVHTRRGKAKRSDAILFHVDERGDDAVVGFTYSTMGESMMAHEQGGSFQGDVFPERSTMQPALEANLVRFADSFEGSVGE